MATTEPRRRFIAVAFTPAEREQVQRLANAYDRSLSGEIRRAVRFYLDHFELVDRTLRGSHWREKIPQANLDEPQGKPARFAVVSGQLRENEAS
jgi:hypothetical protein